MKVTFAPGANGDLDKIFARIAEGNPSAAYEMMARIEAHIGRLATDGLEEMGHSGLVAGTRELLEGPYIIVYKIYHSRGEITIVSVVHGARER